MADAPSGGSGWGVFEILLGILLVIGLLNNIENKSKTTTVNTNSDNTIVDTSTNSCGLSISSPLSLQNISNDIKLAGSINGCKWKPSGSIALYAQVVNGGGAPISEFTTVYGNSIDAINMSFDVAIPINQNLASKTDYLILIPATKNDNSITVRIPLHFVRN